MNVFRHWTILPEDRYWLAGVQRAAASLYEKLGLLEPATLPISDYNRRYLSKHLVNAQRTLEKYGLLLAWSLYGFMRPLEDFVFVEYGAGCGMLSLLAKEIGIGTVVYNDIYDVSCRDAETIAQAIGLKADSYVCGEIDSVLEFLRTNQLSCQAIASYDVIEHIYDIDIFLGKLRFLSSSKLNVVMASGANPHNPWIRRKLSEGHIIAEYEDREYEWGHKERDSLRAYLRLRREIIKKYAPGLDKEELDHLAQVTRGLMKEDIEHLLDQYTNGSDLTYRPDHPTNTCDPYTGNWAEHLMDLSHLEQILANNGFDVQLLCGYWGSPEPYYQRILANMLDLVISRLGRYGLLFSPYFILLGRKS